MRCLERRSKLVGSARQVRKCRLALGKRRPQAAGRARVLGVIVASPCNLGDLSALPFDLRYSARQTGFGGVRSVLGSLDCPPQGCGFLLDLGIFGGNLGDVLEGLQKWL